MLLKHIQKWQIPHIYSSAGSLLVITSGFQATRNIYSFLFCQCLTLASSNCNFPHKCLIPNCNGDYWPKSSTWLFMFDDSIRFWFTIVMWRIKVTLNRGHHSESQLPNFRTTGKKGVFKISESCSSLKEFEYLARVHGSPSYVTTNVYTCMPVWHQTG